MKNNTSSCLQQLLASAQEIFNCIPEVMTKAQQYYHEYMGQNRCSKYDNHSLTVISVFLAEISNPQQDLNGKPLEDMGLNLSKLVRNISSTAAIFEIIEQFQKIISFDTTLMNKLKVFLKNISKANQSSLLFADVTRKIKFRHLPYKKYDRDLQQFAWLLYIDYKNYSNCWHLNEQQQLCLIASVFYFILRYSYEYSVSEILQIKDTKQFIINILNSLIEILSIKSIDLLRSVTTKFDEYINRLIESGEIYTHKNETDFLSPIILGINLRVLNHKHQKSLSTKDFDYRILKNKRMISPLRKKLRKYFLLRETAFESSKILEQQKYFCYEASDKLDEGRDPKFTNTLQLRLCSPKQWQIYRFITWNSLSTRNQPQYIIDHIQQKSRPFLLQLSADLYNAALEIVFKFYALFQSLFTGDYSAEICSLQRFCSINLAVYMMINMISSGYITYRQVYKTLPEEYCIHRIWGATKKISKYCQQLSDSPLEILAIAPQSMLQQESLQQKSVKAIQSFISTQLQYVNDPEMIEFIQQFLGVSKNFIISVVHNLQIPNSENICSDAYTLFKYALQDEQLVKDKHLHQIILCCIFLSGKLHESDILFSELQKIYENIYVEDAYQIFSQVANKQNSQQNLIRFYNDSFINKAREYLHFLQESDASVIFLNQLFQKQIFGDEQQGKYHRKMSDVMDILETRKPTEKGKLKKVKSEEENIQRNETRARLRPSTTYYQNLCNTQKQKYK